MAKNGFTLVELLVVIAVLGVLSTVVLLTINPLEQILRSKDAGRKAGVASLARAMDAYFTFNKAYPASGTSWMDVLVTSGELKSVPSTTQPGCVWPMSGNNIDDDGFCFDPTGGEASIFTKLESTAEIKKCQAISRTTPWAFYSTTTGKMGIACTNGANPQRDSTVQ